MFFYFPAVSKMVYQIVSINNHSEDNLQHIEKKLIFFKRSLVELLKELTDLIYL